MRSGFTTGSCSAAAAKAAAYMLLSGVVKENIEIETPKGPKYSPEIIEITRRENEVSCAVRKDSGDDPDITNHTLIFATVSYISGGPREVVIDGGVGVGRVTKPGLDQPVGNAAINHVPREMITKEVLEVCELFDYEGALKVIISVPEGEELAKKTFNPRLGIVGGISIIGTSGVVEPMSEQALVDTIRVELAQKKALGNSLVAISPGNYGLDFMKETYGYDLDKSVKCSNFIGETLDMVGQMGFEEVLFTGHIGKLIKISLGVMNTHSKYGDRRMEALLSAMEEMDASGEKFSEAFKAEIAEAATTEEAVRLLIELGQCEIVMDRLMTKILEHMNSRANHKYRIECILYSNQHGLLAKSSGADELLGKLNGV